MGGAVKSFSSFGNSKLSKVVDPFGLVFSKDAPKLDRTPFDLGAETAKAQTQFNPLLQSSKALATQVAPGRAEVIGQLGETAAGRGPSLAEAQLKAAQDRNLAQQLAATQASRGGSSALNTRTLLQNMGSSGRDLAQQSAIDKMQERQNAQGAFLSQAGAAGEEAKKDIAQQYAYAVGAKTPQQAFASAQLASQTAAYNADRAQQGALLGGLGSAVGMFAGSDKNMKKDIKPSDKDMKSFVDALSAKKYKYKDTKQEGTAKGERYGVLAQALEKSKAGKSIVVKGSEGKMVDAVQGLGVALASQAALNDRLSAIEKLLKKKNSKES